MSRRTILAIAMIAVLLIIGSWWSISRGPVEAAAPARAVKTGDPNEVAPEGASLDRVQEPPSNTVAIVTAPAEGEDLRFTGLLQPYGAGPSGMLAVRLSEVSVAEGASSRATGIVPSFNDRNALVKLTPEAREVVVSGGTYDVEFSVQSTPEGGVLVIDNASRK